MFYFNEVNGKKTKEVEFNYDMLASNPKIGVDDSTLEYKSPKIVYNFITEDGSLKNGYGFKVLSMPESKTDLENETEVELDGTEIKALWKFDWFDTNLTFSEKYYVYYFNDSNKICYSNLFEHRYFPMVINTSYTEVPSCLYLRQGGEDSLLFSGSGNGFMLVSGSGVETKANAPKFISCCTHYGKFFAIASSKRERLLYSDETDVMDWDSEQTENLDFGDGRGNLNKILSFDDNLYIFRDFGITKLSIYGSNDSFAVSHMYFSDSYIYPNSIVQSGDKVFFLTKSGLKVFNGNIVKNIELDCWKVISRCDNSSCSAACFNGKYYLACRGDFGDNQTVGCEGYNGGYVNNMLFVYDIQNGHEEILRGVDIKKLLSLSNPLKSKLIACFNNEHKDKIAELSQDGKLFGQGLPACITFAHTDFEKKDKKKRIKKILIRSEGDCTLTIKNDEKTYSFAITGKNKLQKIKTNIVGKTFDVKISSSAQNKKISEFVLVVGQEK